MKRRALYFFFCILFLVPTAPAQNYFTVYERSTQTAKETWNSFFNDGKPVSADALLKAENPYNQSLGYLMAAVQVSQTDSVISNVVKSVLAAREYLDTIRYELPESVLDKLASKLPGGREQLLDGMLQLFYKAPWQCDGFLALKGEMCRKNNSQPYLGFTYLNRAFLFTDVIDKPERALALMDTAVSIWTEIDDHLQLANNIKARGVVLCAMQKYLKAEKEIKTALEIYKRNNEQYGISSCQLDLVRVYAYSGELDSMKKYDQLCRPYFEANDTMRLFALNTNRIAAYRIANQYAVRDLIKQTHGMIVPGNINPVMQIEFYRYTIKALEFFNEVALLKIYRTYQDDLHRKLLNDDYFPGLFEK